MFHSHRTACLFLLFPPVYFLDLPFVLLISNHCCKIERKCSDSRAEAYELSDDQPCFHPQELEHWNLFRVMNEWEWAVAGPCLCQITKVITDREQK